MNTFITSDTHFSHENFLKFTNLQGHKVRPFSSKEEMDDLMINNHNNMVNDGDKVYHLGDVTMHKRYLPIVSRLKGNIRLILGNHDIFDWKEYAKYFKEVYHLRVLPELKLQLSHVPFHPYSVKKGWVNVHGHIHDKVINKDNIQVEGDISIQHSQYFNVSVEQHNYSPVPIDVILDYVKKVEIK